MELHRENLKLGMGPEWGTRLAKRMMLTERKPPRQRESEKVRYVVVVLLITRRYLITH